MEKSTKSFITDSLPEFITSDNPGFQQFLEAYYEFLEKNNDSESTSVKDMFKKIDGPSSLINNHNQIKDIDTTLDAFIDYFRKEIIPVSIDLVKTDKKIVLKKIRDVYLAKGTSKSFDLLFKLIYNEQVDLFETRDSIIESSEGKYLSFPLATFRVVGNQAALTSLNFSLANLSHSDDNFVTDSDLVVVLSASVIGKTADSDQNLVINTQLNISTTFDDTQIYRITDQTNPRLFIDIKPMLTLVDLKSKNISPGYSAGDLIKITSKSLRKSFNVIVDSVNNGPVTGLHFRDRGEFYNVGDTFHFTPNTPGDGSGGSALVTEVDKNGRLLSVDGYQIRTGNRNNGFLSDDFENVIIPVISGGSYNKLPDVTLSTLSTNNQGLPYSKNPVSGQGADFSAVSTQIGTIAKLNFYDRGFFADASDVEIKAPMNITLEGRSEFDSGQLVIFEYLDEVNESFYNDSDRIDLKVKIKKTVDSEKRYNIKTIRLPHDFDSDNFQWLDSDYVIDSDQGLALVYTNLINKIKNLNYDTVYDSDQGFKIRLYNDFIHKLDSYHFNQLNIYTFDDSDYKFSWSLDYRNPRLGKDSEVAYWRSTGYFGLVNRISTTKKVISVGPAPGYNFPTDSDLNFFNKPKNRILRVAAYSPSNQAVIIRNDKQVSNYIAYHSRAEFDPILSSSGVSTRTFVNEDGFLNSLSGGVIQDNYIYSNYTYIIQTNIDVDNWRELVKTLLHPAGMIMLAERNINSNIQIRFNLTGETFDEVEKTFMTFDTMLDHYSDSKDENTVSADNTRYEANSALYYKQTQNNINTLLASNYTRGYNLSIADEYGASWFDFEPMGLVRKESVQYDNFYNNYVNFDSDTLLRNITTQDSDGSGYVVDLKYNYKKFNSSIQDFYKKESRTRRSYDPVQIASTKFVDPINDVYDVYDSDLPIGMYVRWSDSEIFSYKNLNYNRLKSNGDSRTFKWFNTDRKKELKFKKANDFNKAMKLDGSLTFTELNGTVYTDFDAYEMIWNTINSKRLDSEGWQINGYSSFVQNIKNKPRQLYVSYAEKRVPEYRKNKTPFKEIVWDKSNDSDNIIWNRHYQSGEDSLLNSSEGTIFDFENNENTNSFRDPAISMKSRKK